MKNLKIEQIKQQILNQIQTSAEERELLAKYLEITKEDSWEKYEGKSGLEAVENFYKSAKEEGFGYAFRSYKPTYFEGFPPELYKYKNEDDILLLDPIVRGGGKIFIEKNKDENLVFSYDKLTETKHLIGFFRELNNDS